ncbi:hypothetical protein AZH46_04130 [Corynebacterium striatum]|uniref:hypothetical protein n=1 Tax=Corynebacterium striatum TaxID=43770 RepID=UPI000C587007|nr:hypothetical protein [Corynebacterium striatum]PIS66283.1 hypothetical protein AZH46_04130 [Corynebacterium striatum]PXY12759.1 hypothetical protein CKF74_07150 [Corynebacterium striatum]
MAVLEHVELAVDGGGVTVARRLAYYSYGKFDVVLPEGREQVELDDRIQNAYISRSPGARMGRFDFGFIRADATVNLESGTSDLELAIDSTLKRSEGDIFVERDVSPAGFRGHRPGVDFGLDDLVFLRVWGNRLRLPVTAIDMSASVGDGPHGSRVHLGGQLVSDGETRRRANNEILLQIAQEKRQRLRQVKAADSKASSAISKADAAQGTADSAVGDAAALREVLSGAGASADDVRSQLGELNRKIQERGESKDSLPLIPAYIAANTARWRVQDELDALQDEQIALTRRLAEANRKALEIQAEMNAVFARRRPQVLSFSKNGAGNDLVSVKTGGNLTVTAKGSWTGVIAVSARVDALSAYAINDAVEVSSWRRSWTWKVGTFESSGGGYVIIMPN